MTALYTRRAPDTASPVRDWRRDAACTGRFDVFFPRGEEDREDEAKRVCNSCIVRRKCLVQALTDEGAKSQWERVGVLGGLTAQERAQLAGAAAAKSTPAETHDYTEVDELLRSGTVSDTQISERCAIPRSSIARRREQLGLPTVGQRRTPEAVFEGQTRALSDGHMEWVSDAVTPRPQVTVQGRNYTAARLAFLVGYGREAVSHVRTTCGREGCVAWQHLADKVMRESRTVS